MSQLARLLGSFAPGHSLDHEGQTFTFARVDKLMRAALEAAYFKRARETVYATRAELSEAEYDRQLAHVTDRYTRGELGFPLGEALHYYTTDGLAELVAAMTGKAAEQCETLIADRHQDVFSVVWCVLSESSVALKKKLLQAEAAGGRQAEAMAALAAQLRASTATRSNGSRPPASPSAASASPSTPG